MKQSKRWRAEKGMVFYCVIARGHVSAAEEYNDNWCNDLHEFGNYFSTRKKAEQAAKKIKELLRGGV